MNMIARSTAMAKRRGTASAPRDIVRATDIRIARGEIELEERVITDERGRVVGRARGDRAMDQLKRYWKRREISDDQFAAGERFALLVEKAETVSLRSVLNRETGQSADGGIITKGNLRRAAASREVDRVEESIGPVLLPVLYWVAVDGRPAGEWALSVGKPERHGNAALCLGLDALVRYWSDRVNQDEY